MKKKRESMTPRVRAELEALGALGAAGAAGAAGTVGTAGAPGNAGAAGAAGAAGTVGTAGTAGNAGAAGAVPAEELPWENEDGSLWTRSGEGAPGETGADPAAQAREQMLAWGRQAEALRELVPDFDLETEQADPAFRALLDKGLTVKQAFILQYFDRLLAAAIHLAAEETERRLVANLRARGQRPPENGVAGAGSFLLGGAAAGLTRQQRAEIADRVRKGETVRL